MTTDPPEADPGDDVEVFTLLDLKILRNKREVAAVMADVAKINIELAKLCSAPVDSPPPPLQTRPPPRRGPLQLIRYEPDNEEVGTKAHEENGRTHQ